MEVPREGGCDESIGGAINIRNTFTFTEGHIASLGAEVGEGAIMEVILSGGMHDEVGSRKKCKDAEACLCGEDSVAKDRSEGGETGKPTVKEVLSDLGVVPLSSKEASFEVAAYARGAAEICVFEVDRASSNPSVFVTNPTSSSSSSTLDNTFSAVGLSRRILTKNEGRELAIVPEERGLMRIGSEGRLGDIASMSSSAASLETVKAQKSMSEAHISPEMQEKVISGRGSNEVVSTSGRTGSDSPRSPPKKLTLTPVVRPLYTDTPAMSHGVVFGISTFGKPRRSNSFATGSVKGATVFAPDGPGHRRAHSALRRVSFAPDPVLEEEKSSVGSLPSSPKISIEAKERAESSGGMQDMLESRKQGEFRGVVEKRGISLRPGSIKTGGEVAQGHEIGSPEGASGQVTASDGGSPKTIDRSALFKRWLKKNERDLSQPEQDKGVSPTPSLHRTAASSNVLLPISARHREKPSLKRATSHSTVSPPRFADGRCESPSPFPQKCTNTPSSPAAGKHVRQLSTGSSKPPKAPKSPPSSPLPPKHPHSPFSNSRAPKENIASLSLGPATIDASVDLGPSIVLVGGSPSGTSQSSPRFSRKVGRLAPACVSSPKTNSVLRKAMSQSRVEPSIHVGSELVEAGVPADPTDRARRPESRTQKHT